jgi:transcription elongation regulator 1
VQNRAAVDGPLSEREMRDAFETHVSGLLRKAAADAREALEAKIVAHAASDFLDEEEEEEEEEEENEGTPSSGGADSGADTDDEDAPKREKKRKKKNPLTSFVAAAALLGDDPKFERCPLTERASQYVQHVERLCVKHGVAALPEEVKALRDELEAARREEDEERRAARDRELRGMKRTLEERRDRDGESDGGGRDSRDSRPPPPR